MAKEVGEAVDIFLGYSPRPIYLSGRNVHPPKYLWVRNRFSLARTGAIVI